VQERSLPIVNNKWPVCMIVSVASFGTVSTPETSILEMTANEYEMRNKTKQNVIKLRL